MKKLFYVGLLAITLTSCMHFSNNLVDDDVYVMKAPELLNEEEVNDVTSFNNFKYRERNNFRTSYFVTGSYFFLDPWDPNRLNFGMYNYNQTYYSVFWGYGPNTWYDPYFGYNYWNSPYYYNYYYNNTTFVYNNNSFASSHNKYYASRNSTSGVYRSGRAGVVTGKKGIAVKPTSTRSFDKYTAYHKTRSTAIVKNNVGNRSQTTGHNQSRRNLSSETYVSSSGRNATHSPSVQQERRSAISSGNVVNQPSTRVNNSERTINNSRSGTFNGNAGSSGGRNSGGTVNKGTSGRRGGN